MKNADIMKKVAAKVGKAKAKIATKTAKAKSKAKIKASAAALVLCCGVLAAVLSGCSTADAPTAQRAQTVTAEGISIVMNFGGGCTNASAPSVTLEIATAAQANETSGAETMTATATQTPTNDVRTDAKFTYGLASDTEAGTSWIDSLTIASAKGLASWLKSGNANGELTVTKTDGTTETVTCKDGKCTTSSGESVTCATCSDRTP